MSERYLVQMHGEPGSGKSTLALAIGASLPAVVLDKDIISTALLKAGFARGSVGPASYETAWDLAASLLGQGHAVVIDSPAFWPSIHQRGPGLARRFGVPYRMVETYVDDVTEIERRLESREALESNPRSRQPLPPGASEPTCERLRLDGTRPVPELCAEALVFIRGDGLAPAPSGQRAADFPARARTATVENRGIWSGHP